MFSKLVKVVFPAEAWRPTFVLFVAKSLFFSKTKMMMDLRKLINFLVDICILESSSNLQWKYSAHSAYYFGNDFH